jgi:hypothetical protein
MKRLLLLFSFSLILQTFSWSQCPNVDSDSDGVLDCIDPCIYVPSSKIGNLSFESDFIGWTIPQNQSFFSINTDLNNTLHGNKSLYITAPNSGNFESHTIYSEEFILEEGVSYNFRIPVKRIGNNDGDALRWVLIDENGIYRHFNNYYSFTEDWTYISFENFLVNFSYFSNNKFRLRLEFGLSTTDMVIDKVEFHETIEGEEPTYADYDNDGIPDCGNIDVSNHPDYNFLVALYSDLNGGTWYNNTNWLDTSKPLSSWYGITETNGRVTGITLSSNNLNGTIANAIESLIYLEDANFSNNRISGEIPDFGQLNFMNSLLVFNNDFSFQDLETNYTSNNSIIEFTYQFQNKRDSEDVIEGIIGNNYTLNMSEIPGTNVQYNWYKKRYNYFINSDEIISSANTNTYIINSLTDSDMDA